MPRLNELLHSIMRINRIRIRFLKKKLAPYHLCGTMHVILTYLHFHPGACQDEIADFYTLDKTTVAREARKLEDMGHIRRAVVTDNRRQYALFNTDQAEAMVDIIYDVYQQFSDQLSQNMDTAQWKEAAALLKQMSDNCTDLLSL